MSAEDHDAIIEHGVRLDGHDDDIKEVKTLMRDMTKIAFRIYLAVFTLVLTIAFDVIQKRIS